MRQGSDPFEAACYWTKTIGYDEVDCSEMEEPTAVISKVVNAKGRNLLGFYYHGDKYVFVRVGLTEDRTRSVIFHEMVHYILYETYGSWIVGRCESEWAARIATDLYNSRPYNPNWRERYEC
jgi:hypothetical protein